MTAARTTATIVHHADTKCPSNARLMMSDEHKFGCSNGRTCPARPNGVVSTRAVAYAVLEKVKVDGTRVRRAMYFCDHCGKVFAHRFGVTFAPPVPTT